MKNCFITIRQHLKNVFIYFSGQNDYFYKIMFVSKIWKIPFMYIGFSFCDKLRDQSHTYSNNRILIFGIVYNINRYLQFKRNWQSF